MPAVVKIRPDQGIAAFYVVAEVRERPLMEERHLLRYGLFGLTLKYFQEKRKLCNLYCLGVNVYAMDVVEEYALSLACCEPPSTP